MKVNQGQKYLLTIPLNESQVYQNQRQNNYCASSNRCELSDNVIQIKSIEIIKNQIDTSCYQKLNISIVLNELNDESRKMIRFISSKYAMNLFDDWDKFWNKQKQLSKVGGQKGKLQGMEGMGNGQLMIIDEDCVNKILRQIKLNPSLRVILLVRNLEQFSLREEYSFMLVTDCCKQIQDYLIKMKKRLILTSRT